MMKKYIYLDLNVIVNYMDYYKKQEYIELVKKINFLLKNNKNIIFPYSPAHIEDIAVIDRKSEKSEMYISQHLRFIRKLSLDYEYLPSNMGVISKIENPKICYERVIKDYDKTIYAESLEYDKVDKWRTLKLSINLEELNKIKPTDIFKNNEILNLLKEKLKIPKYLHIPAYKDFSNNFNLIEGAFELIFDFLDNIGYKNDKKPRNKKEKYRSRMHDITHAIYATKSSIIVTGDGNFKNKLIAIYSLLKVPTVILSEEEFILMDFS